MSDSKLVWSDAEGDLRKKKDTKGAPKEVALSELTLHLRILTSGKGRRMIEVANLPDNKSWCKALVKDLKKFLASGGAYKNNIIEIHSDNLEKLGGFLDKKQIKWKKTGG